MKFIILIVVFLNCGRLLSATYNRTKSVLTETSQILFPATDTTKQPDFTPYADGLKDAYPIIQAACDYCIANPKICNQVRLPVGRFSISHPIVLQKVVNGKWEFFTLKITGATPAKSASNEYITSILCNYNSGFGIAVQLGRGVQIENLAIIGKYKFPNHVNTSNIGTITYSQWNDGSVQDSRYSPYAGIVVDPFCDPSKITASSGYQNMRTSYLSGASEGGTSGLEIVQCAIHNFSVGVMLSPNPQTSNDEMINLIDDNIDLVKVAVAVGQDQSKEIHIDRLKVWAPVFTVLDGIHYGNGTGGGSVMISGMNIAGCVNQLFYLNADRFPLSAKDIYSESLFRIGTINGFAGANIMNASIDFISGNGLPEADYLISNNGRINFYGGCLRYYDGDIHHRLNFTARNCSFRDMTLNTYPLTAGLYGMPGKRWPGPVFDGVTIYYQGGSDTLIKLPYIPNINVDTVSWTSSFDAGQYVNLFKEGDYILGTGNTKLTYHDKEINPNSCPTVQLGRILSIRGTQIKMVNVGLNAYSGTFHDAVYIDRLK